jgi:hypothetical protein
MEQFTSDNLLYHSFPVQTEDITVQSGLNLKRGNVIGKVTANVGSAPSVVGTGNGVMSTPSAQRNSKTGTYIVECVAAIAHGGRFSVVDPNGRVLPDAYAGKYAGTGNGTLTLLKAGKKLKRNGVYTIVNTTAVTNGGVFTVTDPDGIVIGTVTITPGAGGTGAFVHEQLSFLLTDGSTDFILTDEFDVAPYKDIQIGFDITDGSTDFIVGDSFTITVAVGSRECKLVDSSLSDGAQDVYAVLAEDVDASAAAKISVGYTTGDFNENALVFGGTDDIETHRVAMRDLSMFTHAGDRDPQSGATT